MTTTGLPKTGQVHAKQIRGTPDYLVQNLHPCSQGPEGFVFWLLNEHRLTEGIIVRSDGFISYAPAMVAKMRAGTFKVHTQIDGFDEQCVYQLRLLYTAKSGEVYEQYSEDLAAKDWDNFVFDIPLEHVAGSGWFTCVLHINLKTPFPPGDERDSAKSQGLENPHMPVVVRGSYLEIKA